MVAAGPVSANPDWKPTTVMCVYNPEGEFYTYVPSVIVVGETDHIWTCYHAIESQNKDLMARSSNLDQCWRQAKRERGTAFMSVVHQPLQASSLVARLMNCTLST